MKGKLSAVVFDLDSTLADTRPRHHLLPRNNPESSWEVYASACGNDEPIPGAIAATQAHWPFYQVHIVSERAESTREVTGKWLQHYDCAWDYLVLRPRWERWTPSSPPANGDGVISYIKDLQARQVEVVLAYQDWPPLAERITGETDVPCVVVNPVYRFVRDEGCMCQACQVGRARES